VTGACWNDMGDGGKTCKSLSRVESCEKVTDGNGNARKHVTMKGGQSVGLGVAPAAQNLSCVLEHTNNVAYSASRQFSITLCADGLHYRVSLYRSPFATQQVRCFPRLTTHDGGRSMQPRIRPRRPQVLGDISYAL
jgi:hypothetical protein